MRTRRIRYSIPSWGAGELAFRDGLLVEHALPRPDGGDDGGAGEAAHPLAERIAAYFRGERVEFGDVELFPFERTPFEASVLAALRAVPYGETVTYGELAALAGHPGAQRAVGSFCARNLFGLVVPCHRVVASTGPGPYGSLGPAYKLRLLRLEARGLDGAAGARVPRGV